MTDHRWYKSKGCLTGLVLGASLICLAGLLVCGWGLQVPGLWALQNVPVVPGADMQIDGRQAYLTEFGFETKMLYYVQRPLPEVADFYKQEMTERNWKLDQEYSRTVGGIILYPGDSDEYYHNACLVFSRTPMFIANVRLSEVITNGIVLSKTTVIVDTTPTGIDFCR